MSENYECGITIPWTFVQDCSLETVDFIPSQSLLVISVIRGNILTPGRAVTAN